MNVCAKSIFDQNAFELKRFDGSEALCNGKFGFFLDQVFKLIRFAVPVIIIGLTIADFIKAMSSQNKDETKTVLNRFVKRLIIGVIIFVLPTLINYILDIAQITSSTCQ